MSLATSHTPKKGMPKIPEKNQKYPHKKTSEATSRGGHHLDQATGGTLPSNDPIPGFSMPSTLYCSRLQEN